MLSVAVVAASPDKNRDDSESGTRKCSTGELGLNKNAMVDFGCVEVIDDFTASAKLLLHNTSSKTLKITKILKSCSCYSVVLDPESEVLTNNDLMVDFRHEGVTLNKGGLFYDKIGIGLSDGEKEGITYIEYLGYVIRSAISIPDKIDFHQVQSTDIGKTYFVILALPKIRVINGEPSLVMSREIISVNSPDYLDAKLVKAKEEYDIYQHIPDRSISEEYIDNYPDGTITKQQLKRFMATQKDKLLTREDIWYPIVISFKLKSLPDKDCTGLIEVQTDLMPVNIPYFITLVPDFQVMPNSLFWGGNNSASIQLRIRSNRSKLSDNDMQVKPEHSCLIIRTEKRSDNEWMGFVSINREAINEYPLKSEIEVITSSGISKIPVTILK